jgi:hypothetical protein
VKLSTFSVLVIILATLIGVAQADDKRFVFEPEVVKVVRPSVADMPELVVVPNRPQKKVKRVVNLSVANTATAQETGKVKNLVVARAQAKARFAEIFAFKGKITQATVDEANKAAKAYFDSLPKEVRDAYGGKAPSCAYAR